MKISMVPLVLLGIMFSSMDCRSADKLRIGWAETDISPTRTVRLLGQYFERICQTDMHHDPISATVLALESENKKDQAVIISVDLCVSIGLVSELRKAVAPLAPDLDTNKIFIGATHTHTAPYMGDLKARKPGDIMTGKEYGEFLVEKLKNAVLEAWNNKAYGSISRARGTAAVGFCRIVVSSNGKAKMYGNPFDSDFQEMESKPDHDVNIMYFWDEKGEPTGVIVNLACPAQVVEDKQELSADFWHEVRKQLRAESGASLKILGQCGAAGDMSPRDLQDSTLPMSLKRDWPGLAYNAQKITQAVMEEYDAAHATMTNRVEFLHEVKTVDLERKTHLGGTFPARVHVVRLADAVFATNPFELYVDYGNQIKSASPAAQTFLVQLVQEDLEPGEITLGPLDFVLSALGLGSMNNYGYPGYLPTAKAVVGGAYGAKPGDGMVGPAGGKQLVDETVAMIKAMWSSRAVSASSSIE